MSERFEMCAGERVGMIVIKDNQTKETGLGFFKSRDDLSFLEALRDAAQELLDVLKADKNNDADSAEDTEPEQEEKKQPVPYNGTVEVVKGDDKLFPTGLKFKVVQGKISYFSGDLAKDTIALVMFSSFTLKSFKELSELLNKIDIKVKEVKEGEE
jgi:hypothetical protein|nr:MAG TPA: hypothetical protein [Bacteriophage sp.]DAW42592.1 MAG TPA: hypothetical protein [Bacteriophage sp.]